MAEILKTSAAQRDLDRIAAYLQEQASPRVAVRFLDASNRDFARLARMPGLGSICESDHPTLSGLRLWPIRRFKNHLILYRPLPNGIEVLRVFHGAQDIESLFAK